MDLYHLFPGTPLALAELWAARIDGDVVDVGEAFIPADAAETAWMRAMSLRTLLDQELAAVMRTAVWIYGGLAELPDEIEVQSAVTKRVRVPPHSRLQLRDTLLDPADIVRMGSVAVTSPARTLADIARAAAELPETYEAPLAGLLSALSADERAAGMHWLTEHPRMAYARLARERLRQEDVTRYTS